jgi:hypothetical protein
MFHRFSLWAWSARRDSPEFELQVRQWADEFELPRAQVRERFRAYTRQRLGTWPNHRKSFRAILEIRARVAEWGHSIDDLSDEQVAEHLDRLGIRAEAERWTAEERARALRTTFLREIRGR